MHVYVLGGAIKEGIETAATKGQQIVRGGMQASVICLERNVNNPEIVITI
jgi:hypothetical protein